MGRGYPYMGKGNHHKYDMYMFLGCGLKFVFFSYVACAFWVPITATNPAYILVPSSDDTNVTYRYIGRANATVSADMAVGKSNGRTVEYLENGSRGTSEAGHVLKKLQHCNLVWVAYNANSPIPEGAIMNDYSDDSSSVLYVIRSTHNQDQNTPAGYYQPTASTGCISGTISPLMCPEMEMLVQV